jgi:hypothetical protein
MRNLNLGYYFGVGFFMTVGFIVFLPRPSTNPPPPPSLERSLADQLSKRDFSNS